MVANPHGHGRIRRSATPACLAGLLLSPWPAEAHVKWFAPYIVGAPPQPVTATLTNPWFWTSIGLVLIFFLVTRAIEKSRRAKRSLPGWTGSPTRSGSGSTNSFASSSRPSSSRSSPWAAST